MTPDQIHAAYEGLSKAAPVSLFVVSLLAIGGIAVWWLMSRHIKDLKEWIRHMGGNK